jgi:uncharacterized protein YbcI
MARLPTKGQVEGKIAAAITRFEREHLGRGPQEVQAWIIQEWIYVFTLAENLETKLQG